MESRGPRLLVEEKSEATVAAVPPALPVVAADEAPKKPVLEVAEKKVVIPPEPKGPSEIDIWLEKMGLKPPRPDEEGANLMAWWSTRIGLAFGVIAAVFLGMYVNQDTVPWVRLMQLVLVAVGVFGGGCWLERKAESFGRAVSAGGLGLGYVASYACYGLPAMKVVESPFVGVLVQVAALALTAAWALWKGREAIFGLALVLGYVTCSFAAVEGVEPVPLAALLVLSLTGSALFVLRNWWSGLWGAVIGSGLGLAFLAELTWGLEKGPPPWMAHGAMLLLTIFPLVALCYRWSKGEKRVKQVVPVVTTIGLLSGAIVTELRGLDFEIFYASFAVLLLAFGWWWRRDEGEGLWQTLWAKAMVLLALLIVAHFDGPVRGFSLLGQAAILIWLARTRTRIVFEVGAAAAALVGWFLLWGDAEMNYGLAWAERWPLFVYLVAAQGLVMAFRRFVGENSIRRLCASFVAVLIALEVVEVGFWNEESLWMILIPLGFALFALVQHWPLRLKDAEWTPFAILISTLPVLWWQGGRSGEGGAQAALWLGCGWAFYAWLGKSQKPRHLVATSLVLVFSLGAVLLGAYDFLEPKWLPLLFVALAGLYHVAGSVFDYLTLRGCALLAGAISIYQLTQGGWEEGDGLMLALTLLAAILWWAWGWRNPEEPDWEEAVEGARTVMVAVALWAVLEHFCDGLNYPVVAILLSSLTLLAWHFTKGQSLSWLGLVLASFGLFKLAWQLDQPAFPWVVALFFVLLVANGVWLARMKGTSPLALPKVASVLWGVLALAVVVVGLGVRSEVANWTTASWVFAAVALLVVGFWFGLRGYRFVALGGLAVTIFRLFAVDIQDSFWRIVAFGITGALLVGIGYLYNRFHKRLGDGDLDWGRGRKKKRR